MQHRTKTPHITALLYGYEWNLIDSSGTAEQGTEAYFTTTASSSAVRAISAAHATAASV